MRRKCCVTSDAWVLTHNEGRRTVLEELEEEYGNRIGFYKCDVTNNDQFTENLENILKTHKSLDILINNAGIGDETSFELMIDVNYKAVVSGTVKFINTVGKHKGGKGGVVINTASILGLFNLEMPIYCSTKHAVVSFTRLLANQVDDTGVRVMAVCPGLTNTPLIDFGRPGLDFINYTGEILAMPFQQPANVARAVSHIIENGKSGEAWVAEDEQPPYVVRENKDYKSLRVTEQL